VEIRPRLPDFQAKWEVLPLDFPRSGFFHGPLTHEYCYRSVFASSYALLSAVGLRHSREESHGAEVSTILNAAAAFSDQPRLF